MRATDDVEFAAIGEAQIVGNAEMRELIRARPQLEAMVGAWRHSAPRCSGCAEPFRTPPQPPSAWVVTDIGGLLGLGALCKVCAPADRKTGLDLLRRATAELSAGLGLCGVVGVEPWGLGSGGQA
jgi:hypothetical protein